MRFADIPGLKEEKKRLIDFFESDKIHHALLFFGLEGSANLPLAISFASYINCEARKGQDSCGECSSCVKMKKLIHPDLHLIFPVAPSPKITKEVVSDKYVESWRMCFLENPYMNVYDWFENYGIENKQPNISKDEARNIIRKLSLKPFESKYKINIIWLPEYMHNSTANALLKILEEPPGDTLFFLVSNNYQKLLKTILSRVQMFKVKRCEGDDIKSYLGKYNDVTEEEVDSAIYLSGSNINTAEKILRDSSSDNLEYLKDWLRNCYSENYLEINKKLDWFNDLSKIRKRAFLMYSFKMLREALVSKIDLSLVKISEEEKKFITNFRQTLDLESLEDMVLLLDKYVRYLDRNANPKILFLDLSIKISNFFQKVKA
jgi:DNA polymerase-3 subunit delta'